MHRTSTFCRKVCLFAFFFMATGSQTAEGSKPVRKGPPPFRFPTHIRLAPLDDKGADRTEPLKSKEKKKKKKKKKKKVGWDISIIVGVGGSLVGEPVFGYAGVSYRYGRIETEVRLGGAFAPCGPTHHLSLSMGLYSYMSHWLRVRHGWELTHNWSDYIGTSINLGDFWFHAKGPVWFVVSLLNLGMFPYLYTGKLEMRIVF